MARERLGDQIRAYAKQNKIDVDAVATSALLFASKGIINKTPVDEGSLRSNWYATTTKASRKTTKSKNRQPMPSAMRNIQKAVEGRGVYFLTNNLPYARAIEYGLYKKNPVRGSKVRGSKPARYEIRTKNGYSDQAPQGVVRITILQLKRDYLKIIKSGKIKTTKTGRRDWSK